MYSNDGRKHNLVYKPKPFLKKGILQKVSEKGILQKESKTAKNKRGEQKGNTRFNSSTFYTIENRRTQSEPMDVRTMWPTFQRTQKI